MNPLKKKRCDEKPFFFQIIFNEVLKIISIDVKASAKQQEIKDLVFYLKKIFHKQHFQNFKYNVKRAYIFHLLLVDIPSSLSLSVKNRKGCGGILLNE